MTVIDNTFKIFSAEDAPAESRHINPFRSDERCVTVLVVEAALRERAIDQASLAYRKMIAAGSEFQNYLHDWDYAWDSMTGKYYGYVCRDKEPVPNFVEDEDDLYED